MIFIPLLYQLIAYIRGGQLYQRLCYVEFRYGANHSYCMRNSDSQFSIRLVAAALILFQPIVVMNYGIVVDFGLCFLCVCFGIVYLLLCYVMGLCYSEPLVYIMLRVAGGSCTLQMS